MQISNEIAMKTPKFSNSYKDYRKKDVIPQPSVSPPSRPAGADARRSLSS